MELTEEQKNCPYCHGYNPDGYLIKDGWLYLCIGKGNQIILETDYANYEVPINYCPICGRPLSEVKE